MAPWKLLFEERLHVTNALPLYPRVNKKRGIGRSQEYILGIWLENIFSKPKHLSLAHIM